MRPASARPCEALDRLRRSFEEQRDGGAEQWREQEDRPAAVPEEAVRSGHVAAKERPLERFLADEDRKQSDRRNRPSVREPKRSRLSQLALAHEKKCRREVGQGGNEQERYEHDRKRHVRMPVSCERVMSASWIRDDVPELVQA
jgi:hypothetical protein